jgi:hypothetical protein
MHYGTEIDPLCQNFISLHPSSPSPSTPPHASSPRLRAPAAGPSSSRHPRGHAVADADEERGEAAGPIPARWASASLAPATSRFPIFPSQPQQKKILQADDLDAVCVWKMTPFSSCEQMQKLALSPLVSPSPHLLFCPQASQSNHGSEINSCTEQIRSSGCKF